MKQDNKTTILKSIAELDSQLGFALHNISRLEEELYEEKQRKQELIDRKRIKIQKLEDLPN